MDFRFSPSDVFNEPSNNHQQQLTPLSSLSQPQRQLQPHLTPHTLPPLQSRHTISSIPKSSYDLTADAIHTPHSARLPRSVASKDIFGHATQYSSMGEHSSIPAFTQPGPIFTRPAFDGGAISSSQPHPPIIAPAPLQGRLQDIRPMPTEGMNTVLSLSDQVLSQQTPAGDHEPALTHVVGSQGRRGILPSAPGRAAAVAGSSASNGRSATVPTKDADGKFPCPYCSKTYLHAKHLKRHLLRHTGDRPYMCVLCKDTFSRSDILKRHFQKCSLRRGNPTGASHLSHSQAYLKKSQRTPQKALDSNVGSPSYLDTLGSTFDNPSLDTALTPVTGLISGPSKFSDEQSQLQDAILRSNSIKRPSSGGGRDRRSLTGPGPSGSSRASFDNGLAHMSAMTLPLDSDQTLATSSSDRFPPAGHYLSPLDFPQRGADGGSHQNMSKEQDPFSYARTEQARLGTTNGTHGAELDWTHMFNSPANPNYINPMFHLDLGQGQMPLKSEPEVANASYSSVLDSNHDGLFNGLYPPSNDFLGGLPAWNFGVSQDDPLKYKTDQLIAFCLHESSEQGGDDTSARQNIRQALTADNVKHFVELFTNFQGHWPLIHMPTFNFLEAYDGLVMAIICIGAVYSDRISVPQVRQLMEHAKAAVDRTSRVFNVDDNDHTSGASASSETAAADVERMQALTMLQILFTWHGTQPQRESARHAFAKFASLARQAGLLQPVARGGSAYSVLHQVGQISEQQGPGRFDWLAWVEQEKRSRLMFIFFLLDAAQAIYFNCSPQFDPSEIRLPLPADDAAWDARNSSECADMLGLHGTAAQSKNVTGSRRPKQPEMHQAMKALMHPTYNFQPRATNVYSKFILVHGLHVQIWNVQRQVSQENVMTAFNEVLPMSNSVGTPIAQNDWITTDGGSGPASNSNSGQATPTSIPGMQSPGTHQLLKATTDALQKWKRIWDEDMSLQYPPSASAYRRFGFCRDGVHFYWLARAFLRNNRAGDWQAPPDSRFVQVMNLLKKVRTWVASDNAQRGEEIGSVGDIDESYGVEDLTLDMKLLFKPINQQIDSPVPGLQTGMGRRVL